MRLGGNARGVRIAAYGSGEQAQPGGMYGWRVW
jgi:hypothetical protein